MKILEIETDVLIFIQVFEESINYVKNKINNEQ